MFISVWVRRLKPGKTYEDFVDAWYPDKGFGFDGRGPILARNLEDDREILAIGVKDLRRDDIPATMERIGAQEAVRHDRIAEVIESTALRGMYEIEDEFGSSTDETVSRGRPARGR